MPKSTFRFPLPDDLLKQLRAESKRTGAPIAEIIRRALVLYLNKIETKKVDSR